MFISRERYDILKDIAQKDSMEKLELKDRINRLDEKLGICADLLGYQEKKQKVEKYAGFFQGHQKVDETPGEFIARLIAESEEKARLIKLAEDVEKGRKLKRGGK